MSTHGGPRRNAGAKPGNLNALKHGRYSRFRDLLPFSAVTPHEVARRLYRRDQRHVARAHQNGAIASDTPALERARRTAAIDVILPLLASLIGYAAHPKISTGTLARLLTPPQNEQANDQDLTTTLESAAAALAVLSEPIAPPKRRGIQSTSHTPAHSSTGAVPITLK